MQKKWYLGGVVVISKPIDTLINRMSVEITAAHICHLTFNNKDTSATNPWTDQVRIWANWYACFVTNNRNQERRHTTAANPLAPIVFKAIAPRSVQPNQLKIPTLLSTGDARSSGDIIFARWQLQIEGIAVLVGGSAYLSLGTVSTNNLFLFALSRKYAWFMNYLIS